MPFRFGWCASQSLTTSFQHVFVGTKEEAGAADALWTPATSTTAPATAARTIFARRFRLCICVVVLISQCSNRTALLRGATWIVSSLSDGGVAAVMPL